MTNGFVGAVRTDIVHVGNSVWKEINFRSKKRGCVYIYYDIKNSQD